MYSIQNSMYNICMVYGMYTYKYMIFIYSKMEKITSCFSREYQAWQLVPKD